MSNFDAEGRNIGDAIAIPEGREFIGLNVQQGDDVGKAEAIKRIRQATGKAKPEPVATQAPSSQEPALSAGEEHEVDPEDLVEPDAPPADVPAPVSKRSLKLDEVDELTFEFDGEELTLSQEDLKKGAGLYKANNKKAEELAQERKSLDAERTALAAKASKEVNVLTDDIASRQERNRQIDELLELAYRNNWVSLNFKDGTTAKVDALEKEQKANDIAIRRLQVQAEQKQKEVEEQSIAWRETQRKTLQERDPKILDRLDDIASYLERAGFTDTEAQQLLGADARLVLALDKARKFDNALASRGEKKKQVQTKVISKSSNSSAPRTNATSGNSNVGNWQEALAKAKPGSSDYREALKNIRMSQMQRH